MWYSVDNYYCKVKFLTLKFPLSHIFGFFTHRCFCFSLGYCATEGLKFEANGSFYVQRAEKTRIWRRFPLAVSVYRLMHHLWLPLTRFTVQPALWTVPHKTTCQGDFIGGLHSEKVFYVSVLQSSCPHASQRLVYDFVVYIFRTEHVKRCDF